MSSTGQVTSSHSHIQLIIDALADYAEITGIDLSKKPFAATLEPSSPPEVILQLLQEREKAFQEYREGNPRLIGYLKPVVRVLQAFSGILGEGVTQVPISPANGLFVGIDVLLDAASEISSSYDAVLALFECLGNILKHLETYSTIPSTPMMTDIIIKIMVGLLLVLALTTKQIKERQFKKFTKKLLQESEIDTVLQRLDRLTLDEARRTVVPTLRVVHGLVGNIRVIIEDGNASMDSIRQDLVDLHQTILLIWETKGYQLQERVQRWLSPPDPSTNHNLIWEARHRGTTAWFLEGNALKEWKAKELLLWIHGKPGSGKSTLLSAIIQDIEGLRAAGLATMAYHYFDFRDVDKQTCRGLLCSLIFQLFAGSDSFYDIVSRFYLHHRGTQKPTNVALRSCMTDILSLPGQTPIYIIIDALDECPNFGGIPSQREKVLGLIEELVELKLPNVHLCVASRLEVDIRMVLEPMASLKISLHDESGQKEDIIEYIKSVVRSDRRMRRWREEDQNLVIDTLSQNADGMFRWVVCQLERLRRTYSASFRTVLNDLPMTLDETYDSILLGIDEVERVHAQRLFQCLAVSVRPLRIEELAEILRVRFNKAGPPTFYAASHPLDALGAEEAVISACPGLISIVDREGHRVVQFSHFSAKEYLTSERLATAGEKLSYYHVLPESAHTLLAHSCLSALLQLDEKIDRSTIGRFPLAPYAARYWVDHAQFTNVSSHIQEAMENLFDPARPHFAAWVWLYDIDCHWIKPMSKIRPTCPEAVPLYYASLCGLSGLVVSHSPDVSRRGGSHTTPLHAVSVKGHFEAASLLLKCGADPNSRDNQGRAPLHRVSQGAHLSMMQSSLEIARVLVSSGANVNVTDNQGETPLHAAARRGYRDIAQLLLGSGASLDVRNDDQETPLHLVSGNGKLDVSRLLIDLGSDTNSRDKNGFTPLQIASRFGHVDIVRLLLDCGSDVNIRDTQRWTLLHYASRYGHLALARLLVDRGADVGVQGVDLWTALHFASHNGHLDIAKLLIDHGANVSSRKNKQETSLDLASRAGHLDIARFLIESGADMNARDDNGWTPLHTASYFGHLHVAKFLLKCGVDVDIRNGNEEALLHLASSSGKLDVVRFLVEYGADIHVTDKNSWNPVHIASYNGHLDVVHLLIDFGAPVDILNRTQETPLALASRKGKLEVGRFLIERGADVNTRDKQSRAPLHLAAQYGHLNIAWLLLDHGVDANVQKDNLWSPLHLASAHGHLRVAELLVECGARVNVFNGKQETPLHLAAGNGKVDITRLLIDHGANLDTINSNGWTPLHAASRRGHLRVVKLLLLRGVDVKVLNKANKTAAKLASEYGQAEVAKFITEYKADSNILRNMICSTTIDAAQYGADEDRMDEEKASLHTASKEGKVHVVMSLLEQGSDINARSAQFVTPLHEAAVEGKLEVVGLLIERGAEVDPSDMWGCLPLHLASRFGHLEVSRVLVDHGANVNAMDQDRWTPIHLSAGNGHLGIVKLLLERGADIHAVNDKGETPYQISVTYGYGEIADLLRKHGAGRARLLAP